MDAIFSASAHGSYWYWAAETQCSPRLVLAILLRGQDRARSLAPIISPAPERPAGLNDSTSAIDLSGSSSGPFRARLLEMNGGIDVIHPRQGNEMMLAAGDPLPSMRSGTELGR